MSFLLMFIRCVISCHILVCFMFAIKVTADENNSINIAVASNFASTLKAIVKRYQKKTNQPIRILIGSTGKHYVQILYGAPIDLFFAADQKRPKKLVEQKKAVSPFTYAIGKLAYWKPSYKGQNIGFDEAILLPSKHMSIANPKHAPYGLAAKQTLLYLSLWDSPRSTYVTTENINQSANLIKSKAVNSGFIAYSHAISAGLSNVWVVPSHYYSPIKQDAVMITHRKEVKLFMNYIKSDEVKRLIQAHGYLTDD